MSGKPGFLSHACLELFCDETEDFQQLVARAVDWLYRNQYVQSEFLPGLTCRVTRGSGMGPLHSGEVSDAGFWIAAERRLLNTSVRQRFSWTYWRRFRDDVFAITSNFPRFKHVFSGLRSRAALEGYKLGREVRGHRLPPPAHHALGLPRPRVPPSGEEPAPLPSCRPLPTCARRPLHAGVPRITSPQVVPFSRGPNLPADPTRVFLTSSQTQGHWDEPCTPRRRDPTLADLFRGPITRRPPRSTTASSPDSDCAGHGRAIAAHFGAGVARRERWQSRDDKH